MAGYGAEGCVDGSGATARFVFPTDIVVHGEGTNVVADRDNHRLRKIVGVQVTTLAGSVSGATDGTCAVVSFHRPCTLALDEHGRLVVTEGFREDTLRVVEASLVPPLWMGPVEETAAVQPN